MSFAELLLKRTQKQREKLEETAVDDWKKRAPEGFDFEFKDETKKLECPRCKKMIREDEFDSHSESHSSEIFPFLFLGGERNAINLKELTERTNIKHIVNVAVECNFMYPDKFICHSFPLEDKQYQILDWNLIEQIFKAIDDAREKNENVLVHCIQGISRSASIVIAYCMKYKNWNLKQSYEYVKSRRSIIKPNESFINQLRELELKMFGTNSLNVEDVHTSPTICN